MTTLSLEKSIYQGSCIEEAVEAFAHLGHFEQQDEGRTIVITVASTDEDFSHEELKKELANYILSLTIVSYVENTF